MHTEVVDLFNNLLAEKVDDKKYKISYCVKVFNKVHISVVFIVKRNGNNKKKLIKSFEHFKRKIS